MRGAGLRRAAAAHGGPGRCAGDADGLNVVI
jgi:hypothetical protein